MARTLHWRDLSTGLIAFAVVAAVAIGTLFFARVGALRGDKGTLYVLTDDVKGVLPGTEVWLSGEKVGLVKRVRFRSPSTDTLQRLAIQTEILADKLRLIRQNSRANIGPGGSLIGAPVVFLSSGTSTSPAVEDGDTLVTDPSGPLAPMEVRVATLGVRVDSLVVTSGKLVALLNSPSGTVGAFQRNGLPKLESATAALSGLMDKAMKGDGTIGLAMRGDLGARMTRITARKDSLTLLLASGNGSLGKFQKDSTLIKSINELKLDVDSLKARFATAGGGISRLKSDTAFAVEMTRMQAALAALMADAKKNPGRYIAF